MSWDSVTYLHHRASQLLVSIVFRPYFGHLMQRTDAFEKTLMLGKIAGWKRRGWQRMRWLDGITDSMDMIWIHPGSWWGTGRPGVLQSTGLQRVGYNWTTELNWTMWYGDLPAFVSLLLFFRGRDQASVRPYALSKTHSSAQFTLFLC